MTTTLFSEDQYVKKLDQCIYDSVVKFSTSAFIGGLASILFFKRRRWPILVGAGFGLGYAYSNAENALNQSFTSRKTQ